MMQVLVIAHDFPPSPEVGGRRITSFCRYLPEFGIVPIVLTVKERYLKQVDDTYPMPPGLRLEPTDVLANPLQWYSRLKKRMFPPRSAGNAALETLTTQANRQGHRGFLRRQLLALLHTPDQFLGWYLPAVRTGESLIKREQIAAILSSGPPWTAHLIARRLRKRHGIPWLADFRDPWATNLMLSASSYWVKHVNSKMEAGCIECADLVICNTKLLRQSFTQRYSAMPAPKFVTLTNGFDDFAPPSSEQPHPSRRLLLHLGRLDEVRRIDTFCLAVRSLVVTGKLDPTSLKILFVGEAAPVGVASASRLVPELLANKCIEFVAPVSWQRGQEVLWAADLLLLFQGGFREQVPAKFYEYLRTGTPMFAVAAKGALTDLLESTGSGLWADTEDAAGIAAGLLRALELHAVPPEEVERRWSGQFHFRSLTAQLADSIRGVAAQRSQRPTLAV